VEGNGNVDVFAEQQYSTLVHLLKDLMTRTAILPNMAVSLSDVVMPPGRHVAPGAFFDWVRVRAALDNVV